MPRYQIDVVVQETRTLYFDLPEVEDPGPITYAAAAEARARRLNLAVEDADESYGWGDRKVVTYGAAREAE
jgi:hypothetical protein